VHEFFTDSCSYFRILGARRVTQRSKLHPEKQQVLAAIYKKIIIRPGVLELFPACDYRM